MASKLSIPNNAVHAGGVPRDFAVQSFKVGTATDLRPGRFVVRDGDDGKIKVAPKDAENVIGILTAANYTDPTWDGTVDPAVDDEIDVLLVGSGALGRVATVSDLSAAMGKKIRADEKGRARPMPSADSAGDYKQVNGEVVVGADGAASEADILVVL